ncbi:cytidylate kinase-like family protein [Jatrophihabitans sp. DSM 45814]
MPGVTISAAYGAGGSVVAPEVARLLGLQLLDRAISSEVAAELQVSVSEAESGALTRSRGDRFMALFGPLSGGFLGAGTDAAPPDAAPLVDEAAEFRERAETLMRDAMAGGAVILGRAGAAAFHEHADVMKVRLFGPVEARVAQAAVVEHIDTETAGKRQAHIDHAREQYVRRLYRVSVDDPDLFHLQIDSTALPLATCAELIAAAYRGFAEAR